MVVKTGGMIYTRMILGILIWICGCSPINVNKVKVIKVKFNVDKQVMERMDEQVEQKNEELLKSHEVEGTPFKVIEYDGKFFLALGRSRISDSYDTKDECVAIVDGSSWDFMCTVIYAICQGFYLDKTETKTEAVQEGTDKEVDTESKVNKNGKQK